MPYDALFEYEYDKTKWNLDKSFQNGYYDELLTCIHNLLNEALKGNDSLYFAVLTGCLRISKESIFTGFNNMKVHDIIDFRYSKCFGFTEEEVDDLLKYYNLQTHKNIIKEWYNGYQFGATSIYCPWDVMNYCDALLANPNTEPENYWKNASSNDLVKKFIYHANQQTRDEIERLISGESVIKELNQELTYNELEAHIDNLWSILFTTGYLTVEERISAKKFRLIIPNREIHDLFAKNIKVWFDEKKGV